MTLCPAPRVRAPTTSSPPVVELLVSDRPLPPAVLLRKIAAVLLIRFWEVLWSWLFCRTLVGPFKMMVVTAVSGRRLLLIVTCPWSMRNVPVKPLLAVLWSVRIALPVFTKVVVPSPVIKPE